MNRIKRFIKKHKYLFLFTKNAILPFQEFYYKYLISDERLLKRLYKKRLGKELNLRNPETFNEKLQYLKLVQRDEKFSIMSDKYRVREYVKEKIGEDISVPLLWHGENPRDIPWEKLPNKFVIKANHNSGPVIIVTDKEKIDKKWVEKELKYQLRVNYYLSKREYNYKNIPKKIIIEKLLGENINDYKFWVFNGKFEFCQIISDRGKNIKMDLVNDNFQLLPFTRANHFKKEFPHNYNNLRKPKKWQEMIKIAEILSNSEPFCRVDLYYNNNKIFFGELTFYPAGGFIRFSPDHEKYDLFYGKKIELD